MTVAWYVNSKKRIRNINRNERIKRSFLLFPKTLPMFCGEIHTRWFEVAEWVQERSNTSGWINISWYDIKNESD